MISKINETEHLNDMSKIKWGEGGRYYSLLDEKTLRYSEKIFSRHIKNGSILELGPAEGIMTRLLSEKYKDITVVEAVDAFCELIRADLPTVNVVNSLFEDFKSDRKYNNILLGHVLEHVDNPVKILKLCRSWLSNDGIVMVAVPNSNSIHRLAAVNMNLLETTKSLSPRDIKGGHRRVYDIKELKSDFENAGLHVNIIGGYWLKPLSNKQIEESWSGEMIDAFMELGEKHPDIAAEIYVVASVK